MTIKELSAKLNNLVGDDEEDVQKAIGINVQYGGSDGLSLRDLDEGYGGFTDWAYYKNASLATEYLPGHCGALVLGEFVQDCDASKDRLDNTEVLLQLYFAAAHADRYGVIVATTNYYQQKMAKLLKPYCKAQLEFNNPNTQVDCILHTIHLTPKILNLQFKGAPNAESESKPLADVPVRRIAGR